MTTRSMNVTYRKGRLLAAYLSLPHEEGERFARTVASPDALLIVDYDTAGRAIGVEITAPADVSLARIDALLAELGAAPLAKEEYERLHAA